MHLYGQTPVGGALMLWLIVPALLAAYYLGPTVFWAVGVISLLLVTGSVVGAVAAARRHELV